jgi:hypothetical protein
VKVPTLEGVNSKIRASFDKRIDRIVASELAYYGEGAIPRQRFEALVAEAGGEVSAEQYAEQCGRTFRRLTGNFSRAIYHARYVSVVVTFSGTNAACGQLGGLWVGYRSDRSVTIDTKTGKFLRLTDFTSNTSGQVSAALKDWFATESREFWKGGPRVGSALKVCDRPGNARTVAIDQRACFTEPYSKSGVVAWQVRDRGLRLTFPAGDGPRHVLVPWPRVPEFR